MLGKSQSKIIYSLWIIFIMKLSKQQKAIKDYLINSIDWIWHGYTDRPKTLEEIYQLAMDEMQYSMSGKSNFQVIVDWLQWLGWPFSIPYTYYDIQQFMLSMWYKKWDLYDNSYWTRIAFIIVNCK